MTDREYAYIVSRTLENKIAFAEETNQNTMLVTLDVLKNILALLKEQEAKSVESIQMDRSDKWGADLSGYCPSCKRPLKNRFNKQFCGECGQAVKWE